MALSPPSLAVVRRLEAVRGLHVLALLRVALLVGLLPASAMADDCTRVRISDVGWTDISATTALSVELLRDLGYEGHIELLSLPVTLLALRNNDIDMFLGNWMPAQTDALAPYLKTGEVVDLGVNLDGAVYTFAVPSYVAEAGVRSAADLAAHKEQFKGRIHGIAPGSPANRMVLDLFQQNTYGLKGWTLVESSEQGMLGEVRRAVASGEWIVFFGWSPHPMNSQIAMSYLGDPLETWGPGGGTATVHTLANKGFVERCPNLVKLFANLKFTTAMEGELMGLILEGKLTPAQAARQWLRTHPEQAAAWKQGVRPADAPPAAEAVAAAAGPAPGPTHTLPLGDWLERLIRLITTHFTGELRFISSAITWLLEGSVRLLLRIPPLVLIGATALLAFALRRGLALSVAVVAGGLFIWDLGYWEPTMETLVLVLIATAVSVLLGVPLGILAARRPGFYAVLRLLLDLMQTIPTFVYLIPTLMLFGLGVVPGLLSTVVFVLPAPIRLTYLGITSVPRELIEAGEAFGARPLQLLMKIELPHARTAILEGVTQALMLSLSMVVVAALVGAGGLGAKVVRALNTVNIGQGFEAGLVIVILAILLDRMFKLPARVKGEKS